MRLIFLVLSLLFFYNQLVAQNKFSNVRSEDKALFMLQRLTDSALIKHKGSIPLTFFSDGVIKKGCVLMIDTVHEKALIYPIVVNESSYSIDSSKLILDWIYDLSELYASIRSLSYRQCKYISHDFAYYFTAAFGNQKVYSSCLTGEFGSGLRKFISFCESLSKGNKVNGGKSMID